MKYPFGASKLRKRTAEPKNGALPIAMGFEICYNISNYQHDQELQKRWIFEMTDKSNDIGLAISDEREDTRLANYDEARARLGELLARFDGVIYTADTLSEAKRDRTFLNRLRNSLENTRARLHELRRQDNAAMLSRDEAKVNRLIAMLDRPSMLVGEFIQYTEEQRAKTRRRELMRFAASVSAPLGDFAGQVLAGSAFWDPGWDSPSVSEKRCRDEIRARINEIAAMLASLQGQGENSSALMLRYLETLDAKGLDEYRIKLESIGSGHIPQTSTDDNVRGSKLIRIDGRAAELDCLLGMLSLAGADFSVVEDNMPPRPSEIREADFDSFVSFDLETSGSLGAAFGDAPPEIIEIGAVRVEHGAVVARFSELCDPGRSITPTVSALTGITDEMVRGKPSVGEAVHSFAEFAADSLLLGHGIKNSDMIFLERAARREGIALTNKYFDTFLYAKRQRSKADLGGLGLEALAKGLGIEQGRAHRALDDAETTAKVYFALRRLSE